MLAARTWQSIRLRNYPLWSSSRHLSDRPRRATTRVAPTMLRSSIVIVHSRGDPCGRPAPPSRCDHPGNLYNVLIPTRMPSPDESHYESPAQHPPETQYDLPSVTAA